MAKNTNTPVRAWDPRRPDQKYWGPEPAWPQQPEPHARDLTLMHALGWYNYYYGRRESRESLAAWLRVQGHEALARRANLITDSMATTLGWVARMALRGLVLLPQETQRIMAVAQTALDHDDHSEHTDQPAPEPQQPRVNIQDRLRERMIETAGELEGLYDQVIANQARMSASHKPMTVLRSMNVAPPLVREIRDAWCQRRALLEQVLAGKDADLVAGYGHWNRTQIRGLIKFSEQVISDCDSYVQIKKTERAPRKKKPVSPERLTQRFRYLKEHTELKLQSEPATRLVGAAEAWLYDTKKRRLIHVMADSHVGTFTVKGTAIIGFDPSQTLQKTLRRPETQLKEFMSQSVPNARKWFRDLKTTDTKYTGRSNEDLVILRVK